MAVSAVSIANDALGRIGRGSILDFNEKSPEAAQANLHYATSLELVLGEYDWPWARVVGVLTAVQGASVRGWTYAYPRPGDAVEIWRIGDERIAEEEIIENPSQSVHRFEYGAHPDPARDDVYIYADLSPAYIRYTTRKLPVSKLPAFLRDLIAVKLAEKLAMPLRKDAKLMQFWKDTYTRDLSAAKTRAANAEPETAAIDFIPELIAARSR